MLQFNWLPLSICNWNTELQDKKTVLDENVTSILSNHKDFIAFLFKNQIVSINKAIMKKSASTASSPLQLHCLNLLKHASGWKYAHVLM